MEMAMERGDVGGARRWCLRLRRPRGQPGRAGAVGTNPSRQRTLSEGFSAPTRRSTPCLFRPPDICRRAHHLFSLLTTLETTPLSPPSPCRSKSSPAPTRPSSSPMTASRSPYVPLVEILLFLYQLSWKLWSRCWGGKRKRRRWI